MTYQLCTNPAQIEQLDLKKPVMIAGDCVATFLESNRSADNKFQQYIKQPTVVFKKSSFSKESAYVSFHVNPDLVRSLQKTTVHIAINEVISWAYNRAKKRQNVIVINSFSNEISVHVDVLIFTNGQLVKIDEIRGLPNSSHGYTRKLVDEITEIRSDKLRNHDVLLVGNSNYIKGKETKTDTKLSTCSLDEQILNDIANYEVMAMSPFKAPKKLVLVEETVKEQSPFNRELIYTLCIIGGSVLLWEIVDSWKRSQFESLKENNRQIQASTDLVMQDQGILQMWQLRESFVRDLKQKPSNSEMLQKMLQAISSASDELPHLDIKVKSIKHSPGEKEDFVLEVGAKAESLEDAIKKGEGLYTELAGRMKNFAQNIIVRGAPRRQQINGKFYYVFIFTGFYG